MIPSTPTPELTVSVIIPVYNGGENFRRCLSSLRQAVPYPHEVIVVADGDTDSSWRVAQEFGARVIRVPESEGPAKARNLGAIVAQGEIIFFVDADVEIYPDTIAKVAATFNQEPDLAALIGSYDDTPGASNFLSQYRNLLHHYTHQTSSEEAFTFWGACGAIRRDIFLEVGCFYETWRNRIEDIELGCRLKQAGYTIKLDKTLQVKHLKRWEALSMLKADFFYRALPWTDLILSNRQVANDLNLKLSNRISVVLVYTLLAALAATWWWSSAVIAVFGLSLALVVINAPVYQFFYEKRGLKFAISTIFWHWLYYGYSGLAFAIGIVRHSLKNRQWSIRAFEKSSFSDLTANYGSILASMLAEAVAPSAFALLVASQCL
ncbi:MULTISPECIES: glycosyltransferase [unclassified Coleofasciculus]|uniref:glycosyltransferase n=1 Tax=unclassified Coleofasciculus TaxID=2692782 RepID=UPI001882B6A4|nr:MULTISPECIES: glycosyltransferase family 2 protein [unclassified Coleofasciculus]MBE9127579.1 glycosyltransferase family 2 protein [Coleofasciculus sp. LEGE 07081]MBE9149790.1 glycosyltransferase family 2 protein [Coleofasciculus sp. LEGE 07092]